MLRNPDSADPGSALRSFRATAPPEIQADAQFVYDFTRGMLGQHFPGASGPGVGILSMNQEFQSANQRLADYARRECGIADAAAQEARGGSRAAEGSE